MPLKQNTSENICWNVILVLDVPSRSIHIIVNEPFSFTKWCYRVTYRDIRLSLGAVEGELQWFIPVEEGEQALGPEGGDEVSILEPPVETEHSVEVQSQTAAVVHQHTQLLPLENQHNNSVSPSCLCIPIISTNITLQVIFYCLQFVLHSSREYTFPCPYCLLVSSNYRPFAHRHGNSREWTETTPSLLSVLLSLSLLSGAFWRESEFQAACTL